MLLYNGRLPTQFSDAFALKVLTVSVNILRQCDGVHHQGEDKEEGEQLQSQPRRLHSVQGLGEETFPEHTFT